MSFASEVKSELLRHENESCCEASMSRALLLFGREFSPAGISFLTENREIAEAYANAVHLFSGVTPEIRVSESGNCKISVEDPDIIEAVFGEVLPSGLNEKKQLTAGRIEKECCRRSFIRGAFLAAGTVTDPDKDYHLEFTCPSRNLAAELTEMIDGFEIRMKQTKRGGANILYLKKSGDIEDLMLRMGASDTAMMMMGAKMFKDVRNTVNRRVNFENANMVRSVTAAGKQYDAILVIEGHGGISSLPPELQELAKLRLENPDVSTGEIRKLLSDSLTISGVNHRFQKLMKIAEDLTHEDR